MSTFTPEFGRPAVETSKGRVLIVDDDRYLLETLTQFLNDEGYLVIAAQDGAQAISMLDLLQYDLILLDLHLPRVQGTEVAKLFKEHAVTTPIVIMTGHRMGRHFAKGLGLAGCLEKPFGLTDLFAVVRKILGSDGICSPPSLSNDGYSFAQSGPAARYK